MEPKTNSKKQANNVNKDKKKTKQRNNIVDLRGFKLLANKGFLSLSSPDNVQLPP
jgi:hypothetical protein